MKYFLMAVVVACLSFCASPPKDALTYDEKGLPKLEEGKSAIIIVRKKTPPLAYSPKVYLNENLVASVPNNAYTWVYVDKGKYSMETKWNILAGIPKLNFDFEITEESQLVVLEIKSSLIVIPSVSNVPGLYAASNAINSHDIESAKLLLSCCKYISPKMEYVGNNK